MGNGKELEKRKAIDLRDYLQSDGIKSQLESALPKWLSVDRLLRVCFTSAMKNPKIFDCTRESILGAVMQCAQLGLEPILGRAYLIPYNNTKKIGDSFVKVKELQMQVGYQGLIDLARRSEVVVDVWGENVHENDDFELSYGMNRVLFHRPWFMDPVKRKDGEAGEIIGAYAIWQLKDGTKHPEFMPQIEINKRREMSKAYVFAETGNPKSGGGKRDSVWHLWPEEMNLKTVIKKSSKLIPASIEFLRAVEIDDENQRILDGGALSIPETAGEKISAPDIAENDEIIVSHMAALKSAVEMVIADDVDELILKKFIDDRAKSNNCNTMDVIFAAKQNIMNSDSELPTFVKAFLEWSKTPVTPIETNYDGATFVPAAGPEKDPVDDFVSEWNRLKGANYEKYVKANIDRFIDAPEWVLKKAQKKYKALVGEWPGGEEIPTEVSPSSVITEKESLHNIDRAVVNSDAWNELMMLKDRHPDIWKKDIGEYTFTSLKSVEWAIEIMEDSIKKAGVQDNLLGSEVDDIPY